MTTPSAFLSIGQLATRTGLSVSAIRFHEEKGLVFSFRNKGGQRRFLRSDIRRLSFVMIAQKFGFSLREIRDELNKLPQDRTPNKADWSKIGRTFRKRLNTRIEELTRLRDRLDGCIGCGCLSLKACKLYNPNDEQGASGTGARLVISQ